MFGNKNSLTKLAVGLLFLTLLSLNLKAQENIQFSQGKVEEGMSNSIGIPLGGYKGRGLDLPVTLNYSSNLWRIDNINTVLNNQFSAYQTMTQAIYAEHSKAGWKSSLDLPEIEYPKLTDTYYFSGKTYCYICQSNFVRFRIAKVTIHMPDGSSHELRKSDIPYQDQGAVDKSGTFYAVDGSRMRFDSTGSDTGTLYMPDGTRYVLGHPYSYIIDKNGNTQTYNETTRQWTDTLGRTIANPLPANPQTGDFTYNLPGLSGVNNGLQSYTFKWRNLADALTPDANNNTPALRVIASHYLPYNNQDPTAPAPSGNNYPQEQPSQYQSLFYSEYAGEEGPLTMVVGKGQTAGQLFNPVVLTEVILPNGMKYKFSYNIYGEMDKIIYPTGAYEKYQMQGIGGSWQLNQPYSQANRGAVSRKLSENGTGSDILEWQYSKQEVGFGSWGTGVEGADVYKVIAPDKTRTEVYKMKLEAPYHGTGEHRTQYWAFDYADARNGATVEKRVYSSSVDGLGGQLLRRELTEYTSSTSSVPPRLGLPGEETIPSDRNVRPTKNVSVIFEGSGSALSQTTTIGYDTTNQWTTGVDQNNTSGYHFAVLGNQAAQTATIGTISAGALANKTETVFLNDTNYQSRNILGLPTSIAVKDASLNTVSKTETVYDEYALASPGNPSQWQDPQSSARGNVTTVRNYKDIANSQFIETHSHFDKFGNPVSATDGRGNTITTDYSATYNYAYPTSVTTPVPDVSGTNGSNQAFTSSTVYDLTTGLPLSVTDANNQTTLTQYDDALLRPTKTIAPNGQQTISEYGVPDSSGQLPANQRFVKTKTQIDEQKWKEGYLWFDGLGRTIKSQSIESSGDIFVETQYDSISRPKKVTNPYRTSETKQWTENFYDDLSRIIKVKTPDGAETHTAYSLATSGNQIGTVETITDEAVKNRRMIEDALDRLIRVDEPNEGGELGEIDNPHQTTIYGYDTNENLIQINQGGQTRNFVYDSLNRLKSATNPESGTFQYSYDDNGNLLTKTDARNIAATYTYDALNRVTLRNYSEATPDIFYVYDDQNVPKSKGKLTKVSSSVSETLYTAFDADDNILSSRQITNGQIYDFGYTYNLNGDPVTQTYPSGKIVKYDYSLDGNLAQVKNNPTQKIYANSFVYTPHGQIERMRLGNGKWETTKFNPSLQITEIGLGHSANDAGLWKTAYEYGELQTNGAIDVLKNNGNVARQTISIPTIGTASGFTAIQNYSYDKLDRLKSAVETVGGVEKWKQTFDYDRFGNKRFSTSGTTIMSNESNLPKIANPEILTSNNRYKQDQDNDGINDYLYDASGNITKNANDQTFTFDAENRQTTALGSNVSMSYAYDGNDKRIKTFNSLNNQTTIFVYDADGDLAAEYTINVPAPTNPTISYLTEDALGSVRVVTNSFGDVKSRRDFLPFGEELFAGIGSRNPNQKYSANADDTRKKFATYQRDSETGLDYAQSRYYSPMQGRFINPDEFKGGPDELFDFENEASSNPTFYADLRNPQSLNKYQYSYNNPYKYNDPTGHIPCCLTTTTMEWVWEIPLTFPKIGRIPNVGSIPIGIDGKIVEVPRGSTYDEDGSIIGPDGRMIRPPQYGRNSPNYRGEAAGSLRGQVPQPKARPKPTNAHRLKKQPNGRARKGIHEKGLTRNKTDQGGEKGDVNRQRMPNHKKKQNQPKGPGKKNKNQPQTPHKNKYKSEESTNNPASTT